MTAASRLFVAALLTAGAADSATAAQGFFARLAGEHGLSQETVNVLVQDARGFLWVGTQNGLNRYDGYEFRVFEPVPDDPSSLSDGFVTALLANPDGSLWIGTDSGGLNRYDPGTGQFTTWRHDPEQAASLSANRVLSLLRDANSALWVGTAAGLDRFDVDREAFIHTSGNSGAVYSLHEDEAGRLWAGTALGLFRIDRETGRVHLATATAAPVRAIVPASEGRLWLGTQAGLLRFDPAGRSLGTVEIPLDAPGNNPYVQALLRDRNGGLWVGTRDGLAYRAITGEWSVFRNSASDPWSLPRDVVLALLEDRQGVIWVGGYGGGLASYAPWKNVFQRYVHDPDNASSLGQDVVLPLYEDRDGMLWVGTYNNGLDRLDPATGRAVHYRHDRADPRSLSGNEVRAILEDSRGRLWVGTNRAGLNLMDRDSGTFTRFRHDPGDPGSLAHDWVPALLEAPDGGLWVGTWGGGLDYLDPSTGIFTHHRHDPADPRSLSHDRVMALHRDRRGNLWVGTTGGGLNRFDPRTGTFERFLHQPDAPGSLSHNAVEDIYEDASARLWIATRHGLNRFDPETGRFRQYFESDGLTDNLTMGVQGDAEGNLWISTSVGLSRLDPDTETFRNFHAQDGLGNDEFNSFGHHAGHDGLLYFGGMHGIVAFRPAAVSVPERTAPVVLTGLRLFNQPVVPRPADDDALLRQSITRSDSITLDYRQSVISFEFAALDLADAESVHYAYRLDGLDGSWIETGASRRVATYTHLPPGEFRFLVRARHPGGRWSAETALAVVVEPPPWRTAWAYALYAAAGLLLLMAAFHYFRQRLVAEHLARERDAAERATRMKSAFLAVMSHEIRTPLNGVLGMLELLGNTRLARKQREYVQSIQYAGQALLTILNDILDYSRIEAEQISFERTTFSLRRVIDSLILLISARAAHKRLALEAEIGDDVPDTLEGDPARLRQVLLNLLGNAVKFTEHGGVTLRVRRLDGEEAGVRLRFEVGDTGPGIDPARQRRLFQDYAQADPSITRRYGGTGLGLAICRRLVEAQGGAIGLESRLGDGATFWFELGFDTGDPEAAAHPEETPAATVAPLRVLLVDDIEINREVATGLLRLDGHRVEEAEDGRHALQRLGSDEFDLVLMDVRMPDMDGMEAARRIRALPEPTKAGIPIVGLTASVQPDEIRRCLDAGMNQVLRKPITRDALRRAFAGLSVPPEAGGSPAAGDDVPLLDEPVLEQHCRALGIDRLRGIVERFRQSSTELRASLLAAEPDDAAVVREASHKLAGAAAGLGCLRLSERASVLEADAREGRVEARCLTVLDACFDETLSALDEALDTLVRASRNDEERKTLARR